MPPIAGLHDICAIRSVFIVIMAVRKPMRAQARAASQPACPAPTTTASYRDDFTAFILRLAIFSVAYLLSCENPCCRLAGAGACPLLEAGAEFQNICSLRRTGKSGNGSGGDVHCQHRLSCGYRID